MIDYLFDFLKPNGDLNYVLTGYFAKIFSHILSHKTTALLKYIFFQRFYIIDNIITNSNRKSISECLLKILHSSTEDIKEGILIKLEIIDKIISFLATDSNEERVENLVNVLIELLNNKIYSMVFLKNLKLFNKIHLITCAFVKNANSLSYSHILTDLINVLTKLNENILKDFGASLITPQPQKEPDFLAYNDNLDEIVEQQNNIQAECYDLKKSLEDIVGIIINTGVKIANDYASGGEVDNSLKNFSSTYNRDQKVLGVKRLTEFDFIKSTYEILLNTYVKLESGTPVKEKIENFFEYLIDCKFFEASLENFYVYEFNNFYQKSFEHMILLICNIHTPSRLIRHIFGSKFENSEEEKESDFIHCDFLNIILEKSEKNLNFNFEYDNFLFKI